MATTGDRPEEGEARRERTGEEGLGREIASRRRAEAWTRENGFEEETKEEGIGNVGIGLVRSFGCQRYFWADPITQRHVAHSMETKWGNRPASVCDVPGVDTG
jgi:hypothetical protein